MANKYIVTEVTYDQLVNLIQSSELREGLHYLLSDFRTKFNIYLGAVASEDIHQGNVEPLLLTAISRNKLSPVAHSATYPKDIIRYDVTSSLCEDGITTRPGTITFRMDEYGNEAYCDVRNAGSYRIPLIAPAWDDTKADFHMGDLVSLNGVIYKCCVHVTASVAAVGVSPEDETTNWVKFLDITEINAFLWNQFTGSQSERVGFISDAGVAACSFGEPVFYHLFSKKDGSYGGQYFHDDC